MREVGLIPTSTGERGGRQTGQHMTQVIDENGRYAGAVAQLLQEHPAILYHDRLRETETARLRKAASKTRYTCPECGVHAWAKPDVRLVCGACAEPMQAQTADGALRTPVAA